MRLEKLYTNFPIFAEIANSVIDYIRKKYNREEDEIRKLSYLFLMNKVSEARFDVEFSHLVDLAVGMKPVQICDIDKFVLVNGEMKAIFELKIRRRQNGKIDVNGKQYELLQRISGLLDIPVYYFVKVPGGYRLVKVNFLVKELKAKGNGWTRDRYVTLNEGIALESREEAILALRNVLLDDWMVER